MFLTNYPSFSESLRTRELQQFTRHSENQERVNIDNTVKMREGNVLYYIDPSSVSTNELLSETGACSVKGHSNRYEPRPLLNSVTEKVLNMPLRTNYAACIKEIAKFRAKAGRNFYGAVLRSDSQNHILVNPFHPVTAAILASGADLPDDLNVLMYFYRDRDHLDDRYISDDAVPEQMQKDINNQLRTLTHKLKPTQRRTEDAVLRGDHVQVTYQDFIHVDATEAGDVHLVTHQVLTKGILCPYYGSSIITKNQSKVRGRCLTPFLSCNISLHNANEWGSVCTGNQPRNFDGFQTLTHANLNSPFNKEIMLPGALVYADMCIQKSIEIYQLAGILGPGEGDIDNPIYTPEPPIEITTEMLEQYETDKAALLLQLKVHYDDLTISRILTKIRNALSTVPKATPDQGQSIAF